MRKQELGHSGLEQRLEDFANRLMASFSQAITNERLGTLNWILVLVTVVLVVLTVVLIIISLN